MKRASGDELWPNIRRWASATMYVHTSKDIRLTPSAVREKNLPHAQLNSDTYSVVILDSHTEVGTKLFETRQWWQFCVLIYNCTKTRRTLIRMKKKSCNQYLTRINSGYGVLHQVTMQIQFYKLFLKDLSLIGDNINR